MVSGLVQSIPMVVLDCLHRVLGLPANESRFVAGLRTQPLEMEQDAMTTEKQTPEALAAEIKRLADSLQARSRDASRTTTVKALHRVVDDLASLVASATSQQAEAVALKNLVVRLAADIRAGKLHPEDTLSAVKSFLRDAAAIVDTPVQQAEPQAVKDANLLDVLIRMESAFDWFVGRSGFTQSEKLKGLEHSAKVRKEVYAAHDAVRAAIAATKKD